ncbi:hypothetical protein AALB39_17990 [Lachnospiraceae bacterium 54-53]
MTDIEALNESIAEKLYTQEPLAEAILSFLAKGHPEIRRELLANYDQIIARNTNTLISEAKQREADIESIP